MLLFCYRWTGGRLLVMIVVLNLSGDTQALKELEEMNWEKSPQQAWPNFTGNDHIPFDLRSVLLILNVANYTNTTKSTEKTVIATGVLLDNSRILTSYKPFRELINEPKYTNNIVAVLVTAAVDHIVVLRIANVVCGRQVTYVPADENNTWFNMIPVHDLMVLRMEEEIGNAELSSKFEIKFPNNNEFNWEGDLENHNNALISFPALPKDALRGRLWICSLGFRNEEEKQDYDKIVTSIYEEEDLVLVDCAEWLPRLWGFYICIRNIHNFSGLGSGASLFTQRKLFGIGSFAMFKNDTGILVFTDVRYYVDLIMKTCGDEEFT